MIRLGDQKLLGSQTRPVVEAPNVPAGQARLVGQSPRAGGDTPFIRSDQGLSDFHIGLVAAEQAPRPAKNCSISKKCAGIHFAGADQSRRVDQSPVVSVGEDPHHPQRPNLVRSPSKPRRCGASSLPGQSSAEIHRRSAGRGPNLRRPSNVRRPPPPRRRITLFAGADHGRCAMTIPDSSAPAKTSSIRSDHQFRSLQKGLVAAEQAPRPAMRGPISIDAAPGGAPICGDQPITDLHGSAVVAPAPPTPTKGRST